MWARIENGLVAELTDIDPDGRFHKSIQWESCSSKVTIGWQFKDGRFSAPDVIAPEPLTLEQVQAQRQWAYSAESDALKIEAEYDAISSGSEPDYSAWLAKVAEIKAKYPLP